MRRGGRGPLNNTNVVFEDPLSEEEVLRPVGVGSLVGCQGHFVTDEIDILCDGTVSAAASGFSS